MSVVLHPIDIFGQLPRCYSRLLLWWCVRRCDTCFLCSLGQIFTYVGDLAVYGLPARFLLPVSACFSWLFASQMARQFANLIAMVKGLVDGPKGHTVLARHPPWYRISARLIHQYHRARTINLLVNQKGYDNSETHWKTLGEENLDLLGPKNLIHFLSFSK